MPLFKDSTCIEFYSFKGKMDEFMCKLTTRGIENGRTIYFYN